ncbi:TRAP transporter large permease subunit [Alkalilacustris brevis]|uniref:TRAP transporter large permease n=1 Tax=Alkalilacustris brevis TaxID=2026338 RepID=UPI003083DF54
MILEWYFALGLLISLVVGQMMLGVPVAIAFMAANLLCAYLFMGDTFAFYQVVDNSTSLITRFQLAPVPFFILMGALFFYSGIAQRVFTTLDLLLGRIPGRLCFLTVGGGALFSTLTGSSMANTAMLGSMMVPEMERRGYHWRMSLGPILGTGGLAMIIPPSTLGVLLATVAGLDVGRFLIAGILPGLVLGLLYTLVIVGQVWRNPSYAPQYEVAPVPLSEKLWAALVNLVPMGFVVFMVVGLILLGIATPTESAAFGVLSILILMAAFRVLSYRALHDALLSTVKIGGMVFFIILNSSIFSQLLAYSGASSGMLRFAASFDVNTVTVLLFMFIALLFLGMFMDPVSMILITTPIFFPLAQTLGINPLWFGLFVLICLEMSQTTPPFGLLLYVMLGVAPKGTTLRKVAIAAAPYLGCDAILIVVMYVFPSLVLYLPSLL